VNQKRQLKECSKPNLKSEQNWERDQNNDTITRATMKEKAKRQGSVKKNET